MIITNYTVKSGRTYITCNLLTTLKLCHSSGIEIEPNLIAWYEQICHHCGVNPNFTFDRSVGPYHEAKCWQHVKIPSKHKSELKHFVYQLQQCYFCVYENFSSSTVSIFKNDIEWVYTNVIISLVHFCHKHPFFRM